MNPNKKQCGGEASGDASARTCGVPEHLWMATIDVFQSQPQAEVYKVYTVVHEVSVACANAIALLTKVISTGNAYDTQGGVAADGSLVRLDLRWITKSSYVLKLKAIAKRFNADYESVLAIDLSFRVKRSRGNTYADGKCLVYYAVNTQAFLTRVASGVPGSEEVAAWFDITETEIATEKNAYELSSERRKDQERHTHTNNQLTSTRPRLPRSCAYCEKLDTYEQKHQQCACKIAAYCGVDCQRAHWRMHKKFCTHAKKKNS
jgi:hypothetical protein